MAEEVPKENHILLALDLAGVEIEYIDNIGKIWRATNNVAQVGFHIGQDSFQATFRPMAGFLKLEFTEINALRLNKGQLIKFRIRIFGKQ